MLKKLLLATAMLLLLATPALLASIDTARATPPDPCAVVLNTPDGFLAFREGPGPQFRMIQKLSPGDTVVVYFKDCEWRHDGNAACKQWVKVFTDTARGWVRSKYIQLISPSETCS
jgi:Bacterial SH3 domain